MTARLDSLSDSVVATRLHGSDRLDSRSDLPAQQRSTRLPGTDQVWIGVALKELHQLGRGGSRLHRFRETNGTRKPTPIGLLVPALAAATSCSTSAAEVGFGIIPKPPASETAAASAGVPIGPPSEAN